MHASKSSLLNPQNLHELITKLSKEPLIQKLYEPFFEIATALNIGSSATNFLSTYFSYPKALNKIISNLGQLSSSLGFFTMGVSTAIDNFAKNNFITAFGHSIDTAVSLLPQSLSLLGHGFAEGFYCLGAALNTAINKNTFENKEEYFEEMKKGFKKIIKSFKENPKESIIDEKTGVLGTIGSLLVLLGSSWWKITGSKLAGATIRSIGEMTLISNQINPQNKQSKPNYFQSGKKAAIGTVVDYIAKFLEPKLKPILYPIAMAYYFSGQSHYVKYQRSPEINNGKVLKQDLKQCA